MDAPPRGSEICAVLQIKIEGQFGLAPVDEVDVLKRGIRGGEVDFVSKAAVFFRVQCATRLVFCGLGSFDDGTKLSNDLADF